MSRKLAILAGASAIMLSAPAFAQTSSKVVLYELPAYLGRSVTISKATPDLSVVSFANRAQSAKFTGEWQACSEADYQGSCLTMTGNKKVLLGTQITSLRTTADAKKAVTPGTSSSTAAASTTASASASATVDLDALDPDAGTEGQDVAFFARPALSGSQVSAGSNDTTSGAAFCKLAGYTSAAYAGRARVQAAGLIDLSTKTKVRAYPLRDVLCRR